MVKNCNKIILLEGVISKRIVKRSVVKRYEKAIFGFIELEVKNVQICFDIQK